MSSLNETVLVTGSSRGIGRAIALRLGTEGVTVGVFDINPVGAAETVKAIEAADGKAIAEHIVATFACCGHVAVDGVVAG